MVSTDRLALRDSGDEDVTEKTIGGAVMMTVLCGSVLLACVGSVV